MEVSCDLINYSLEVASALVFGFAVPTFISTKNFNPIVHKKIFQVPVFLVSAFCGVRLWEKLVGHYLNFEDGDVAHDFKIKYEDRYKLFDKDSIEEDNLNKKFSLQQIVFIVVH